MRRNWFCAILAAQRDEERIWRRERLKNRKWKCISIHPVHTYKCTGSNFTFPSVQKKKWNIDYRAIVRWWHKKVINGWAKIKGPIKEMTPVSQGEGQIERGVNLVVIHLAVSGMEIKIERVLMLEITVHLSRTPATRDIKGLFQMRRLSEKVRLCGIVTIGNTILYSFLYFDCSGTWKLLEGAH